MNQFAIGYTTNPKLRINKVFRDKSEKFLKYTFHQSTMKVIQHFLRKKDTCVIVLVMFYDTKTKKQKKCIGC